MKIICNLLFLITIIPTIWGTQASDCGEAPPLSDDQVKDLIADKRAKHADIPAPFKLKETHISRGINIEKVDQGNLAENSPSCKRA
jgi:hypothetical protein